MHKEKILFSLMSVILVLVVVNVVATFDLRSQVNGVEVEGENIAIPSAPTLPQIKTNIDEDDDAYKGKRNAPVTIVEFSDFQCPFCAKFYTQTLPLIQKNYIDTGKVKFVYRDFPLGFHPNAQKAAEAAECAGEQNKFWEMHDMIFENQQALSLDNLKVWASDIGLNKNKFNSCLDSGKMASEVQNDIKEGSSYGVTGTPAFFVNGVKLTGAQPYQVFEQAIEQALN